MKWKRERATPRIERISPGVTEWKIRSDTDGHSIAKIVLHQEPGGYKIQLKFAKDLSYKPNQDHLKGNKELTYHRVVASRLLPNTARKLGEALIEAADQVERRKK